MHLDKLRIFYYAAQAQSFTNCGLNLSPSVISRHVEDLEHFLKTKLFVRNTRGMTLTLEGTQLLHTCQNIFQELEALQTRLSSNQHTAEGLLKITTPSGWISTLVVRLLKGFLDIHEGMRISMKSIDYVPDFVKREADIALLPFAPKDDNIVAEKLMSMQLALYASPEYLEKYGTPQTVEDLAQHRLVSYGDENAFADINWHLKLGMPNGQVRDPYLSVNNLYYAGEAGYGIVTLARENILLRENRLIPILPDVQGPLIDAYAVFPKKFQNSKRIQAFITYLKKFAHENKWHCAI